MSIYDVGDFWSQTFYVKDKTGALADPTGFTCTLKTEDGTAQTVTIVHSAVGTFDCSFGPLTEAHVGHAFVFGAATGTNACSQPDSFDVRSSISTAILSLSDARGVVNFTSSDQDEKLRDKLDVATAMVERIIGPVIPKTVTEDIDLCGDGFFTRRPPIISITSLTPVIATSTSYVASDFQVLSTGKVVRKDGAWLNGRTYTVVYQAGRTGAVDPDTLEATRVILKHLWEIQRGQKSRPGQGGDDTVYVAPYSYPPRALELLQFKRHIGVA